MGDGVESTPGVGAGAVGGLGEIADGDIHAFVGQAIGDGTSEAAFAAGAGDEGDFALEVGVHGGSVAGCFGCWLGVLAPVMV